MEPIWVFKGQKDTSPSVQMGRPMEFVSLELRGFSSTMPRPFACLPTGMLPAGGIKRTRSSTSFVFNLIGAPKLRTTCSLPFKPNKGYPQSMTLDDLLTCLVPVLALSESRLWASGFVFTNHGLDSTKNSAELAGTRDGLSLNRLQPNWVMGWARTQNRYEPPKKNTNSYRWEPPQNGWDHSPETGRVSVSLGQNPAKRVASKR